MRVAKDWTRKFKRFPWSLAKARDGGVYMIVALMMPVLVGFTGMGIDLSEWYYQRRITQSMADAAAMAGTYVHMYGGTGDTYKRQSALREAIRNGYEESTPTTVEFYTNPAPSFSRNGNQGVMEVVVRRPANLVFTGMFVSNITVSARAIGAISESNAEACLMSLAPDGNKRMYFLGNADINLYCEAIINSTDPAGTQVQGSASVLLDGVTSRGDINEVGGNNVSIDTHDGIPFDLNNPDDPYQDPYGDNAMNHNNNPPTNNDRDIDLLDTAYSNNMPCVQDQIAAAIAIDPDFLTRVRDTTDDAGAAATYDLSALNISAGSITLNPNTTSGLDPNILVYHDTNGDTIVDSIDINSGATFATLSSLDAGSTAQTGALKICGDLTLHGSFTFETGVYFIENGDIGTAGSANSASHWDSKGSAIVLTGNPANSDIGEIHLTGSPDIHLTGASEADLIAAGVDSSLAFSLGGMLFTSTRDVLEEGPNDYHDITGSSDMQLDGIMYFPNYSLRVAGGGNLTTGCAQVIAWNVQIGGNSNTTQTRINHTAAICATLGIESFGTGGVGTGVQYPILIL